MTRIDPRFQAAKQKAAARRRRGNAGRILIFGGSGLFAVMLGLGAWLTWDMWSFGPGGTLPAEEEIAFDEEAASALTAQFVSAFVDLAGDPMLIQLSDDASLSQNVRHIGRPNTLDPVRVVADLVLVSDVMVSKEVRFITTLPSSQEDFAFFQAQRTGIGGGRTPTAAAMGLAEPTPGADGVPTEPADAAAEPSAEIDDSEAGWGETLDNTEEALPEFRETAVENTTSVAFVRTEVTRSPLYKDTFIRVATPGPLADSLIANGFTEADAALVTEAAVAVFERSDLAPGEVLALRGAFAAGEKRFVQLSLYAGDVFVGSLARTGDGGIAEASDPWVRDDLFNYSDAKPETEAAPIAQYRILDAFYSTGIRNRMPATTVGEAILLLSKAHDLNSFASPGDRMTVLYAEEAAPDDPGGGQILYASLKGEDVNIECFVFSETGTEFTCYGASGGNAGGGAGALANGMIAPVRGVMTSTFGPRTHPILKTARIHKGVDWAAPIGTPVTAAFDGEIAFIGDGGDYGNLVKLAHANGFETRYAHMNGFAEGARQGQKVRAGDLIGYLGSTGLSTGPHLHFELRLNGESVDPMGGGSTAGGAGAVDALVDQIVRVESGGRADAKNPLSSATGLGQFIESTWLRMMKTYRPDLSTSLSREELLELRNDPTISRQMITNLARESEAYLRARGHSVTAGRLYLAHFLGAEGASTVLAAVPETDLAALLGEGVVKANPFLTGKNCAFVIDWAEQKMSGKGRTAAMAPDPPGLNEFRAVVRALLEPT